MTVSEKKMMLLEKERYSIDDLVTVVEVLRSEEGCPWDREQDHKSIRKDFIEEINIPDRPYWTVCLITLLFQKSSFLQKNCEDKYREFPYVPHPLSPITNILL